MQVQDFLSRPDFPTGYIPPPEKIDELMKSMDNYENSFKIKSEDNNEEILKVHTWKNPYPEMYSKNSSSDLEKVAIEENKKNKNIKTLMEIKENLTCYISRSNYIDNRNILLGYPIQKKDKSFIPIPEILSYEGYLQELSQIEESNEIPIPNHSLIDNNLFNFILSNDRIYNESTNNSINRIMNPLSNFERLNFIRRALFHFNRLYDLNSSNNNDKFKFKSANNKFYDCWLPIYINKEHFKKNKTTILNYFSIIKYGNSGLKKYDFHSQYIFEVMPNILGEMIRKMATENISSSFIKCFFQYVLMYKKLEKKYNNILIKYQIFYLEKHLKTIIKSNEKIDIFKETLELLILFFYCDNQVDSETKDMIEIYIEKLKNLIFFECLEDSGYEKQSIFISDLKEKNLFDKIVNIIFINYYFSLLNEKDLILAEILKNKIVELMNTNFFKFLKELNSDIKKIIKDLLINEINFENYFTNDFFSSSLHNDFKDFRIFNILPVFHLLKEKILDKNLLEQLEKNLGIFLDTEQFIKEINNIKKYKFLVYKDINENNYYKGINDINSLYFYREFTYQHKRFNFGDFLDYKYRILFSHKKFPFIEFYNSGDSEFKVIPDEIRELVEKEENNRKKLCMKRLFKIKKKKNKIKNEIKNKRNNKNNRINIKNSYDKNNNKGFQKYLKKKYTNKKLLLITNKYKK